MKHLKIISLFILVLSTNFSFAQVEEKIINDNIQSVKLYRSGDQTSFPAINLNSGDVLELHFDDLDADIKNYYYGFQLCNADWTPSMLNIFEYVKGFQSVRITNYRTSSLAQVRYTHYQTTLPERNSYPTRSGNYILKVFVNGDTSQTVLTKRFVVVDNKTKIAAQIQQPFNGNIFGTHQKLNIAVQTDNRIQLFSPTDLKVVVLQNSNWKTALFIDRPTISRGNFNEYSDEGITAMPAGKEWRWIDLRSFRLLSDRMQHMQNKGDTTHVTVKPDAPRSGQAYIYYRDLNGSYVIETMESINPYWQGDYAYVHFSYFPPGNRAIAGRDVYVFGELTNYANNSNAKMIFNEERGAYEATLFLKQGFYNYSYVTLPYNKKDYPDYSQTEGDHWSTENSYVVLVYYRPFGGRADELIGITSLNSVFQRP